MYQTKASDMLVIKESKDLFLQQTDYPIEDGLK